MRLAVHNENWNPTLRMWGITTKIIIITGLWWHGGSRKVASSSQITTRSGTGEKETLTINVVGKTSKHMQKPHRNKIRHGPGGPGDLGPAAKSSNPRECAHTLYYACASPFRRMRLSILSNAPVYFGERLILFFAFTHLYASCIDIIYLSYQNYFYHIKSIRRDS